MMHGHTYIKFESFKKNSGTIDVFTKIDRFDCKFVQKLTRFLHKLVRNFYI